jgi:nifR3 family TIM-barrel protein
MSRNFWEKLDKPILALAPMADVTDAAFRSVIARYGKPHVFYTEFVSADGLVLAPEEGKKKLLLDLKFSKDEHPIVAQFFTSNPVHMKKAAELAQELGFDGVDINMGCPDRSVEKQGAGAALIKNPKLARELIRAAKEGAGGLPVSVKTRLGYNTDTLDEWLRELLEEEPAAIILHARTRKEMSKVPARWERVKRAVEIRDEMSKSTLILGNGDLIDLEDARNKVKETGADGAMLGRAIFGNPFLFSKKKCPEGIEGLRTRLSVMVEHTKLFEELLGHQKSFSIMKKHYKAYVTGFDGAAELRGELMNAVDASEVGEIVKKFIID